MLANSLYLGTTVFSTITSLPLDFVKTQLQLQSSIQKFSWRAQFIGSDTVLVKSLIFLYLKQKLLKSTYEGDKLFLIPSISLLSFVLSPFDHILVKLQTKHYEKNSEISNTWNTFRHIYRNGGVSGLYRGGLINFARFFSFFTVAELSNVVMYPYYVAFWKFFLAMAALIPPVVASQPFDVVKTHLQRCGEEGLTAKECCLKIYEQRGIAGFYAGIGQTYARMCFVTICTLSTLEIMS